MSQCIDCKKYVCWECTKDCTQCENPVCEECWNSHNAQHKRDQIEQARRLGLYCEECERIFSSQNGLKSHLRMSRKHTEGLKGQS